MLKYIFFAICLLSGCLQASPMKNDEYKIIFIDYEGVTWRCKRCGYYNYSESRDWKGDYFCLRCGTKKGDE